MAEKWLSAKQALEAVRATTRDSFAAARTIAARAHAEMIEARAERLILPSKTIDDANVPAEFWWAEGGKALKQNWATGDFSTWINQKHHMKAFGVRFNEADIAMMTNNQSDADDWVSTKRALVLIEEMGGGSRFGVGNKVVEYLRIGHITARADAMTLTIRNRYGPREESDEDLIIPEWFWADCTASGHCALDWQSGIFSGKGFVDGETHQAKFIGVKLRASELVIFGDTEQQSETSIKGSKGGRGRLPVWDDLLIEIAYQLYDGCLKPKRQADIAQAMHDYASEHGHEVSDTAIRDRARKLWNRIEGNDGN